MMIWSLLNTFFNRNLIPQTASPGPTIVTSTLIQNPGECAVCLSTLEGESSTRVLPCLHEFHQICVNTWLAVPHVKTCPVCRFSVDEEDPKDISGDDKALATQDWLTDEMLIWFSSFHVADF